MKKSTWINLIVVLVVIIFAAIILSDSHPETDEEVVKCIGEKSELYTQLGCSHCETQEKMFGENIQYLNIIDCFYEKEKCSQVDSTPTWKIKGRFYTGVQSIETLQNLTGC